MAASLLCCLSKVSKGKGTFATVPQAQCGSCCNIAITLIDRGCECNRLITTVNLRCVRDPPPIALLDFDLITLSDETRRIMPLKS